MRDQSEATARALVATILFAGAVGCGAAPEVDPDEVVVFAAASLADVVAELGEDVWRPQGLQVAVHFGGSNLLARQVERGAPVDVLLVADLEILDEVTLPSPSEVAAVAGNRLVVAGFRTVSTADDLVDVPRLATADPASSPAGRYADRWLESVGLREELDGRLIRLRDVRATLAAVRTGHADLAIVYATDAAVVDLPVQLALPSDPDRPILYGAALVRPDRPSARAVFETLRSGAAESVFRRHGFAGPSGDPRS